jgi:alkylhydroperoxidase family enzyme
MRLGVDEIGVTELMAVTEHAVCLSVVAAALLLEGLGDEPRLVAPLDPADADEDVRPLLDAIRRALAPALGAERIPALWRALARNRHYLESTWRKEQVVMDSGQLAPRDKRRVALGIAMNARSRYMIEYHVALLRHAGDSDEDLLEILGVVDHYNCLNTLSDGMQLSSDIRPPA